VRTKWSPPRSALRQTLFGPRPSAEVVIAYGGDEPVGFALFFHNYSTFLGSAGSISRICSCCRSGAAAARDARC
jgi:hypothetical protein